MRDVITTYIGDARHRIFAAVMTDRGVEFVGIAAALVLMISFGAKMFDSPLFAVGQLTVVLIVALIYLNPRLALIVMICGIVAFEDHDMSTSFAFWNAEADSSLLAMRIFGLGLFDALTLLFLIPTLMRELTRVMRGEKMERFPTDRYLIPFVLVYLFGMIMGAFNHLAWKNYFAELHDFVQIPAFYFVASRTLKTPRDASYLQIGMLAVIGLKSLLFIQRYVSGGGVFFGYNYYRVALGSDIPLMALLMLTLVAIFIIRKDRPWKYRIAIFFAIGYASILLVATIGRSTYILTIISLITTLILLRRDIRMRHVLLAVGMFVFGGLVFVFVILEEQNRELIGYAITTAFNWVEALKFYGDLSLGERVLELFNIWETLAREGAVLWGKGWGAAWSEVVVHHPFNKGSYPISEQYSGIHTSAHVDAVFFLLKVGIIGTIGIYVTHLAYLIRGMRLFRWQREKHLRIALLFLIIMMILFIPNYTYFGKLKILLGISYGCIAVFDRFSKKAADE